MRIRIRAATLFPVPQDFHYIQILSSPTIPQGKAAGTRAGPVCRGPFYRRKAQRRQFLRFFIIYNQVKGDGT